MEVTKTINNSPTDTSLERNGSNPNKKEKSSLISGGSIAGIVVGCVAGVAIIGLLFLWLWKRRRQNEDDEDDFFSNNKENSFNEKSNPFSAGSGAAGIAGAGVAGHNHNNSNTTRSYSTSNDDAFFDPPSQHELDSPSHYLQPPNDYGRRRLSDGSLPDMVQRNPTSLKVVNN